MGKGEIALYEQFLLFPQCFQKVCFPGASKGVIGLEWVKMLVTNIFSFPRNIFYPIQEKNAPLETRGECRLQMLSIWTRLKFCLLVKGQSYNRLIDSCDPHQSARTAQADITAFSICKCERSGEAVV